MPKTPLVAIVGQTASGKSALALELAKRFDGEIICADSRTIYKGLDIGTAKPTAAEQAAVPHWLLDVAAPNETFSAARFQQLALATIEDISGRGKLPILVGGSGLYIDSVLFSFDFNHPADESLRTELQSLSVEELQNRLSEADIPLPENSRNPRYLMRALETGGEVATRSELRPDTLILELDVEPEVLKERITQRVDAMIENGFVEEAKRAVEEYGWEATGLQAPGYKAFQKYLKNEASLEEAKQEFTRLDWQLAKRQRTWFKRNKSINHLCNLQEAVELTTTFLNKSVSA